MCGRCYFPTYATYQFVSMEAACGMIGNIPSDLQPLPHNFLVNALWMHYANIEGSMYNLVVLFKIKTAA